MARMTGLRPCEISALRWSNIDPERGAIIFHTHKTRRKTHRPRIIPVSSVVQKLFTYIRRHSPRELTLTLGALFSHKELVSANEVAKVIWPLKVRDAVVRRVMTLLGVKARCVSGRGGDDWEYGDNWVYSMDRRHRLPELPESFDHVFLNVRLGNPWNRSSLGNYIQKLRKRANVAKDCRIYGLRHAFATNCILNDVPVQLVAELLGHCDVRMTLHYLHLAGKVDRLRDAMEQGTRSRRHYTEQYLNPPNPETPS